MKPFIYLHAKNERLQSNLRQMVGFEMCHVCEFDNDLLAVSNHTPAFGSLHSISSLLPKVHDRHHKPVLAAEE
jgi:hypothetical protein